MRRTPLPPDPQSGEGPGLRRWGVGLGAGGMALAIVLAALAGPKEAATAGVGGLAALALFGPIYLLGRRWPSAGPGGAFGLGDVKLSYLPPDVDDDEH